MSIEDGDNVRYNNALRAAEVVELEVQAAQTRLEAAQQQTHSAAGQGCEREDAQRSREAGARREPSRRPARAPSMKERMDAEAALALNHGGQAINAAGRWICIAAIRLLRGAADIIEFYVLEKRPGVPPADRALDGVGSAAAAVAEEIADPAPDREVAGADRKELGIPLRAE